MNLNKKQIQHLKGVAHSLKPVILLGSNGLTEAVIAETDYALNHHELIKIKFSDNEYKRISKKDIENTDVLVGLGIADDWSFEEDFRNFKNVRVYAYDASIDEKVFFKNFVKSKTRFFCKRV